ncbi:hypothetical protein B5F36_14680, partial [Anaerofilum sp. An201]
MKSLADGKVTISTALDNSGIEKDSKAVEDSARKTAMKLAAEYRKAGMSQSEALKKAWSEIERTTSKSSKKSGDAIRKNMGGATQSVVGSLGGLNAVAGKLMGVIAGAFSVYQIAQFGAACIELGSDVAEVQNVVDTSFDGMAYKMEEFADTAITSFGMSELAAKKTGSTYMAMARGMGVVPDAASDMAIALTGLSGDVANFFNISQEDAAYKLRSIFTGETEALKDLGVVMTQANLQQYAMTHGMNSNIQAMSQAEKVALQYSFVVDSLKLAAGDFARTQNNWANQVRILSMQWQEFMSVIGQTLTTVLLPVVKMLNTIVAALINMANTFNTVISALFGGKNTQIKSAGAMADANSGIAASAADAADNEQALADAATAAGKAAKSATLGIDELNVVQQDTGSAGGGSGSSGGAGSGNNIGGALDTVTTEADELPASLVAIQTWIQKLNRIFAPSLQAWADAFVRLKRPVTDALTTIRDEATSLWKKTLSPLARYVVQDFVPDIVNAFNTTFAPVFSDVAAAGIENFATNFQTACWTIENLVQDIVGPAFELAEESAVDALDGISAAWEEYGGPVMEGWRTATNKLGEVWKSVYEKVVGPVLEKIMDQLDWLWSAHLKPLWDQIYQTLGALGELITVLWNEKLLPTAQKIADIVGPLIEAALGRIIDTFGTLLAAASDLLGGVLRVLEGLCEFVSGVFTGNWQKAWNGVKDIFGGVWDGIVGIVKGAVNTVIDLINW